MVWLNGRSMAHRVWECGVEGACFIPLAGQVLLREAEAVESLRRTPQRVMVQVRPLRCAICAKLQLRFD